MSAGPTPHTPLEDWTFTIENEMAELKRWSWESFRALPSDEIGADIHCVTKWSKLDTTWAGVSIDTLLDGVEHDATHSMDAATATSMRSTSSSPTSIHRDDDLAATVSSSDLGDRRPLLPHRQ